MPVTPGQGQSDVTEFKERGISAACAVSLRIFAGKFAQRYRYFHFDINAGSGWNTEVNCIGSPVAFVRQAIQQGVDRFAAHFCDIDADACRSLLAHAEIGGDSRCSVFHGDNRGLVPAIPDVIQAARENPRHAIGTVLIDPNGCGVPLDELSRLNAVAPKLDFIVNWNSVAFKRNRCANGGTDLRDALRALGKKHWLIRKPLGIHQFTLLVGRNLEVGAHKALGFYDLDTSIGRYIFDQCDLTRSEFKSRAVQSDLFPNEVSKL